MTRLKQFNKVSYILLLLIVIVLAIMLNNPGLNLTAFICGTILFIATLLIASLEGLVGAVISATLNSLGAWFSYVEYMGNSDYGHLVAAIFQVGIAIACCLIGYLSHKQIILNSRLQKIAYIDFTTEAHSHRYFHEIYEQAIKTKNNNDSIVLLDVDNFSEVNENYGYNFGDEVLKDIVRTIRPLCHENMSLCRLGGDVFAIYCYDYSFDETFLHVNILKEALDESFKKYVSYKNIDLKVSFGLANYPSTSNSLDGLLQDSFSALKYAKNTGKDNVKIFKSILKDIKNLVPNDPQMEVSLKVMLGLMNKKDEYTQEHSLRVADYLYIFGEELGISQSVLKQLKAVALLHDIGKVKIPINILTKDGNLTNQEYDIIKTHVELGAEFVKDISFVTEYSDVIYNHHERYDGKGYPEGLAGTEIPYYARVICIVDAYDAMLSQRPYRKPLSKEVIIQEFKDNMGKQFDPELTKVFLRMLENNQL